MEEWFNYILLFKTNINSEADKQCLYALFDTHPAVETWNIDQDDEDNVLRIVSHDLSHQQIIDLVNGHGFNCTILT